MKNLFLTVLVAVSFASCEDAVFIPDTVGGTPVAEIETAEATILGRWVPMGFEDNVRDEFTEEKRHTLYGSDGEFPTLEDWMAENPGILQNDWEYDGDVVVIDLNFGNYSRLIPTFKCNNYVVEWRNEAGEYHSTSYREGHDIEACN